MGEAPTSSMIKANCTASALKGLKISARDEAAVKGYKKDGQTSKLRQDRKSKCLLFPVNSPRQLILTRFAFF